VIPLIVTAPRGITDKDVFPPDLCFQVDAAGVITDTPETVLA
jgi:hypothetical protein